MIEGGYAVLLDPPDRMKAMVSAVAELNSSIFRTKYVELLANVEGKVTSRGGFQRRENLDEQLATICQLGDNWDSYGAPAPSRETAELAHRTVIMSEMARALPSAIVASAQGGVALCWDVEDKHAYIEFCNDGSTILATYRGMQDPRVDEIKPTAEAIVPSIYLIRDFLGG